MELDERKRKILKAIVDDFIHTAEPVGSRTISRRHGLGLSSASIRNEMADLEEMGYLDSPHVSAGRIPSDKGYRFYVDQLLSKDFLTQQEVGNLYQSLCLKIHELDMLVRSAINVLSKNTRYTTVASAPSTRSITVLSVTVVFVDNKSVLVVVVFSARANKNFLVHLPNALDERAVCELCTNFLYAALSGRKLTDAVAHLKELIHPTTGMDAANWQAILAGVRQCFDQIRSMDLIMEGTHHILGFPEFQDLGKARGFLDLMDQQETLSKMVESRGFADSSIEVHIGKENDMMAAHELSILVTAYCVHNGEVSGTIGIIGPKRMDYAHVIKYMNYIREYLNQELTKWIE